MRISQSNRQQIADELERILNTYTNSSNNNIDNAEQALAAQLQQLRNSAVFNSGIINTSLNTLNSVLCAGTLFDVISGRPIDVVNFAACCSGFDTGLFAQSHTNTVLGNMYLSAANLLSIAQAAYSTIANVENRLTALSAEAADFANTNIMLSTFNDGSYLAVSAQNIFLDVQSYLNNTISSLSSFSIALSNIGTFSSCCCSTEVKTPPVTNAQSVTDAIQQFKNNSANIIESAQGTSNTLIGKLRDTINTINQ